MKELLLPVQLTECSSRADRLLLLELRKIQPLISRSQIEKLFDEGRVYLDSRLLTSNHVVGLGDHVIRVLEMSKSDLTSSGARPSTQGSFLSIVYEDSELLVVNKATGIPSVPLTADETETAVGSALAYFPALPVTASKPLEPGLLHRLDTGTSGLLAFAKTQESFLRMKGLWKSGGVTKVYRALVRSSVPLKTPLTIRTPLAHDPHSKKKMIALIHEGLKFRGKALPAVTHLLSSRKLPGGVWDLEILIETGVMHQIRCHLASLGMPILGDPIYRGEASDRLWLHAWKLEIVGKPVIQIQSNLPEKWPV